jgi:hypothetical protein
LLLEDNDGSHGHGRQSKAKPWDKTNPYDFPRPGLATKLKADNWIALFRHPPQSPDLNPIEACWNILKQRLQNREWWSLEELKEVIQDEWSKITIAEIRARISDMPRRCKLVAETGGKAIKSAQW